MTRQDFIDKIKSLGFVDEFNDNENFYIPSSYPLFRVAVNESTAYATYDYLGDTGPIEINLNPVVADFDQTLSNLKDDIRANL